MKGIIALDIDGTITAHHQGLNSEVLKFLQQIVAEGWILYFITGRTFLWGFEVLQNLNCPYYFAIHNGVTIYEMPSGKILFRKLLNASCLADVDSFFADYTSDYIIYTETLNGSLCYFRPDRLQESDLNYLAKRSKCMNEKWVPVDSYSDLPVKQFSALKFFGPKNEAEMVSREFQKLNMHAPVIRDPFDPNFYIIQATHQDVSKGQALVQLKGILNIPHALTIAAGDDNNDSSMLAKADISIAMATAPEALLKEAHVIAPPAEEKGIIKGLEKAFDLAKGIREK